MFQKLLQVSSKFCQMRCKDKYKKLNYPPELLNSVKLF